LLPKLPSLALTALLLVPLPAAAQNGQDAALVGVVHDSSGATVAGATVQVTSGALVGGPQRAMTDAAGTYRFAFLPPGAYDVRVQRAGFATTGERLTLTPGATLTLDFVLALERLEQSVEIRASAPIIDVHTSASPTVIDRDQLETLPLARGALGIVNLAPGVTHDVGLGGTLYANPLFLDGTSANEPGSGQAILSPNLNWIDEVQVISIGADARYGEYTGAMANAITRSGSNRFSGRGEFWTTRPSWSGNNRGSLSPAVQQRFRPVDIKQRYDTTFQAGGPVAKDRVWFFAGGERYRDKYRPASFYTGQNGPGNADYDSTEWKGIGKLTAAPSARLRVEGYVERSVQGVDGANASPLISNDALAISDIRDAMWNARALWTVSDRTVVEFRQTGQRYDSFFGPPEGKRDGPPAHVDLLTSVMSVNYLDSSTWSSSPVTASAEVTTFPARRVAGQHEIRAGFEYEHDTLRTEDHTTGGLLIFDTDGRATSVQMWAGAIYRPRQSRQTVYAQDSWTVADRLTVNAGLRAGFYNGSVPTHPQAFAAHALAPRLGAAWDVTGDHRTAVRVHYGRYQDPIVTSFYDFLDPLSQSPTILADVTGDGYVETFRTPVATAGSIDPDIRFPYMQEIAAGVERQLPWALSATAQFVRRDYRDAIGFTDPGIVWQPVIRRDPGPDGRAGTADDGGPITVYLDADPTKSAPVLTNPDAHRRYRAAQFILRRRGGHSDLQASYTWSRTTGNYYNAADSNAANGDLGLNGTFVNPNKRINGDGLTNQDFTHEIKVLGSMRLQVWGPLTVGAVYRYQSGAPWQRAANFGTQTGANAIFVEPRGSRRTAALNAIDVRAEKTVHTGGAASLGLFVDVFNVTNQGEALRVSPQSGPNLGLPLLWTDPRSARAGVHLVF
jgi:hypothetical protein